MSEFSETELTDTAVKMLTQGSGYRSIRAFLKKHCDEETEDSIVRTLIQYEKENKEIIEAGKKMLHKDLTGEGGFSDVFYKVIGGMVCVFGVFLFLAFGFMWIPLGMIGIGGYTLARPRHRR